MIRGSLVPSLKQAGRFLKRVEHQGFEWAAEVRELPRQALKQLLEQQIRDRIDRHLREWGRRAGIDRRNGSYRRRMLTELGEVELVVARTRRYNSSREVLGAYARRSGPVNRVILGCFLLGLSTRKVAEALLPWLGERFSASTVSRIARQLDALVAAYHRRRIPDRYRVLVFDGVVMSRRTGAGAVKRPVLVVLGIRPDGKKEIIDFRLARAESEAEWERFLTGLFRRGLEGKHLEMIVTDGGAGLLRAVATVFPDIPVGRCWAHKTRNILDKVRKADWDRVKRDLQKISHAPHRRGAEGAAGRFARRWSGSYPRAVQCLRDNLEELLEHFRFPTNGWRTATRTTNAIERRFREVRRRTRPMGSFSDRTSIERILFAVFSYENRKEGTMPLFLVTQNS
jgi:transposase-like protein